MREGDFSELNRVDLRPAHRPAVSREASFPANAGIPAAANILDQLIPPPNTGGPAITERPDRRQLRDQPHTRSGRTTSST